MGLPSPRSRGASRLALMVLAGAVSGCAQRSPRPATAVAVSPRPVGPVDAGSVDSIPILFRMSQRGPSSIACVTPATLPESRGLLDPKSGVTYEGPLILGLEPNEIQQIVHQHEEAVRTCYEAVLVERPFPRGRVATRFSIDELGQVRQSCLDSSTLNRPQAESCILDQILTWEFPRTRDGGWVIVQYPFVLEPDECEGPGAQ